MSNNGPTNANGARVKPQSEQLVAVSRPEDRAAAVARVAAFPYRFPRDRRQIGGAFTVEENAQRLQRYFYFERRLAHALGSWTLAIPELEVMLETGRHIFYHMDAARTLRERLTEQEVRLADVDGFRDAAIDRFIDEMLSATDTAELLVGVHLVAGRAIELTYRHHIDDTDPVTDAPTIRILKRFLVDYEPMLEWADSAIEAFIAGGIDESRLARWRWHLERVLGSIGGVRGAETPNEEPRPMRVDEKPYERGTVPMRDERFVTFNDTGDYDKADGKPRFAPNTYETYRMIFLRTQRDEVDAIEAFGTFLWDIAFRDFDAEYMLARITWDEARHTEIGHRALAASGYEPFELPNRLTPSTCRGPMEPEYAMAEINLFGEVAILKTISGLVDEARRRDDSMVAHIADYIRADERTHVRKGQTILKAMTGMKLQELEYKTRELFTECFQALGAMPEEGGGAVLTREEIEHLVGE